MAQTWTAHATTTVPVAQLLSRLASQQPLLALALTPATTEAALLPPPYPPLAPRLVWGGRMLDPDGLKTLVTEHRVSGVLLGGSGLFRADGGTQYGARKLISGIMGVVYESDWLPRVVDPQQAATPVWLCRRGLDDPTAMLLQYIRDHAPAYCLPAAAVQAVHHPSSRAPTGGTGGTHG